MNTTTYKNAIKQFKEKTIDLLIITQDMEGILNTVFCNTVITYDPVENLKMFIQLKGRARVGNAEFIELAHETCKADRLVEMENFLIVVENMQFLMKINVILAPNKDYWKTQLMDPSSYIEIESTGAKISKHNAKNFLEWYFKFLSNENKYLEVELKFTSLKNGPGGFREQLELPKIFNIPPITTEEGFISKKDCRNELSFKLLKQLVEQEKFDEHLYPINKKKIIERKKEKIILLENNKNFKMDNQFLMFNTDEKYIDNKGLCHEIMCKESNDLYLQAISIVDEISNVKVSECLGILHSVPLSLSSFKINVTDMFNTNLELKTQSINIVTINPPILIKVTVQQFQYLRFFYYFMLHLINNAMTLFIEGILNNHFNFFRIFLDLNIPNPNSTIFEDLDINPINNNTCHLLIVPLIDTGKEINWEIINSAATCIKDLVKEYFKEEIKNYPKINDVILNYETNAPEVVLSKRSAIVKVHKLDGVREAAYMITNVNPNDKDKNKNVYLESCRLVTGVDWRTYIHYQYVPSILTILNEKRFYQELTAKLLIPCVGDNSIFEERKGLCNELLENAFTVPNAQRGLNYERLELLGDAILEHIVVHYVPFIITIAIHEIS